MRTIIGIAGFVAVVVATILIGTPLSIFIDLPSLLIVVGTTVTLTVSKHQWSDIASFSDEVAMSIINFSLVGGGIGFIIGLVQMFANLSDPGSIGPAVALSLLTVFYSLILAVGIYAAKKKVNSRRIGIAGLVGAVGAIIPMIAVLVSFSK